MRSQIYSSFLAFFSFFLIAREVIHRHPIGVDSVARRHVLSGCPLPLLPPVNLTHVSEGESRGDELDQGHDGAPDPVEEEQGHQVTLVHLPQDLHAPDHEDPVRQILNLLIHGDFIIPICLMFVCFFTFLQDSLVRKPVHPGLFFSW